MQRKRLDPKDPKDPKDPCFISTLELYKKVPMLILINSQDQEFRAKLVKRGGIKLLSRVTTSPKRLIEEVRALIG